MESLNLHPSLLVVPTAARVNVDERGVSQCSRSPPLRLQDEGKHSKTERVDSIHIVGMSAQSSGKLSGKLVMVEEMVDNIVDHGMSRSVVDHEGDDGVEVVRGDEMLVDVGRRW